MICHYKYCNNPVPLGRRKYCSRRCISLSRLTTKPLPDTLPCANPLCDVVFKPESHRAKYCCTPCGVGARYCADRKKMLVKQKKYYTANKKQIRAYQEKYRKRENGRDYQRVKRERERAVAPPKRGISIKEILHAPAEKSAKLINELIREA